MTNTRQDVHRPSVITPTDYDFVAFQNMKIEGFGDIAWVLENRNRIRAHMERTGGTYAHVETTGGCQVCGNVNVIWTALFHHRPTNTYIRVGLDCAAKLDMQMPDASNFRRQVSNALEARAGKQKAQAVLAQASLSAAWDVVEQLNADRSAAQQNFDKTGEPDKNFRPGYEELTIEDIVGKLVRYGSISEAQTNFISKLLDKIGQRAAIQAQRQAEADAAGPAPTGRVKVTGTVLALKTVERPAYYHGDDGVSTKVLIRLDNGSKVWGNRFANIEKGDRVEFTARFETKDDPKFAFFSRPKINANIPAVVPVEVIQ